MEFINFWTWLGSGSGGRAGYSRLTTKWVILDIALGVVVAAVSPMTTLDLSEKVILPLAGVFIGVAISWSATAYTLISTNEIDQLAEVNEGGFENYVYPFQLAILLILTTEIFWALISLGLLHPFSFCITDGTNHFELNVLSLIGMTLTSLSVRTAWQTVDLVSTVVIYARKIRNLNSNNDA